MNTLTRFLRSLGNTGALANAQAMLDARRNEDWLVLGLMHGLESTSRSSSPAAAAAAA